MVTIVRDRIQDLVAKGMTLAQVKAARPTLDYDGRYGATDWSSGRPTCSSRLYSQPRPLVTARENVRRDVDDVFDCQLRHCRLHRWSGACRCMSCSCRTM